MLSKDFLHFPKIRVRVEYYDQRRLKSAKTAVLYTKYVCAGIRKNLMHTRVYERAPEAERVFRTISWERSRLRARVVEQSECLKSWLRQIIKSGDFATVDIAVEVINLEESNKTMSGDAGSNAVGNKEAYEAAGEQEGQDGSKQKRQSLYYFKNLLRVS